MRSILVLLMGALLAGCAAGTMLGAGQGGRAEDGRSYEAARADNLLAAEVNRALVRSRALRAGDINVGVQNAVVTLQGTVSSEAAVSRAGQIVQKIKGVRSVDNRLTVAR